MPKQVDATEALKALSLILETDKSQDSEQSTPEQEEYRKAPHRVWITSRQRGPADSVRHQPSKPRQWIYFVSQMSSPSMRRSLLRLRPPPAGSGAVQETKRTAWTHDRQITDELSGRRTLVACRLRDSNPAYGSSARPTMSTRPTLSPR